MPDPNDSLSSPTPDVQGDAPALPTTRPAGSVTADEVAARLAALEKERDEAISKAREQEEAARYWHEQAKAAPRAPAAAPPEEPQDEDVLTLATQGGKAFEAWLKKKGFVSREEAAALAKREADSRIEEAKLLTRYEDLADPKSEFFKATKEIYASLVREGVPQLTAMKIAAKQVDLERKALSAASDRGTEAERNARAAAQGSTGKRGAAPKEQDEELTVEQKWIADAMGVSHEAYKKRAKEGVRFGRA